MEWIFFLVGAVTAILYYMSIQAYIKDSDKINPGFRPGWIIIIAIPILGSLFFLQFLNQYKQL